ncbi:MAG: SpoIIE family protein phosphatase, partial [Acidobacteria bacterium]|nr:SpoIIE family protein phosphatase [Acidobacteriota bacterium]
MASAQIKVINRFGVERLLPLDKPVFTIGRKAENDLQMLSDTVSRQHAEIRFENEAFYILDIGSKRGTYVNDQRIERAALSHNDRIRIGGDDEQHIIFLAEAVEETSIIFDTGAHSISLTYDRAPEASANEELQKLSRYLEVNQAFKFSLSPDDVLCLIVDAAIEMAVAERGFLMLLNQKGELEFKIARDKDRRSLVGNEFAMSRSVVEEVFKQNRAVIVNESTQAAELARHSVRALDLRTIACIPLRRFRMSEKMDATAVLQSDVIGVLYVDSHFTRQPLTNTAVRLLESLAFEATKTLESIRLMHEEREKKQLEEELQLAAQVQSALAPTNFKQPAHFEVAAAMLPSREVGGDFYELMTLKDGRCVFALGDVSGKGIAAAILAGMAQGALQAQFIANLALTDVITNLNKTIAQRSDANRFLTMFCATIDADGHLTYINAGHNPPLLLRTDGTLEKLSTKSVVLGAFDFAKYEAKQTRLQAGDALVIYSDGVTEAADAQGEMFGEDRLDALVQTHGAFSAENLKTRLLDEVVRFTKGEPQS